jgi:AcrR family transcriptional regulator
LAQVKKEAVRQAILEAAYRQFQRRSYVATTLQDIAAAAKVSRANIYVYFRSKFDLLYAVFQPWMASRLDALEATLATIEDPRLRLARVFKALWRDIPGDGHGFANNLIQAVSTATQREGYSPKLLQASIARVAAMIEGCLTPAERRSVDSRAFAHVVFMAFDGFSMHAHLRTGEACSDAVIDTVCDLLLPSAQGQRHSARRALAAD